MKQISGIILSCLLIPIASFAVDIGSDTSVTRFNNQVLVNDGDRIAGFAGLNAGFQLFNSTTTALFDSFFPVSGDIELSSGQLNLNQDLILHSSGRLASLGTIAANSHKLSLGSAPFQDIPAGTLTECEVSFLTQQTFSTRNVVACDWSVNDQFIAVGLQPNVLPEVQVYEFIDQTSLDFRDNFDVGNERVATVSWHPTELWLATGNNSGTPELRIFTFDGSSLTEIQNVNFTGEVRGVKYHPSGNFLAVTTTDNTQEILIYPVNGDGTLDTGGAVTVNLTPDQDPDVHSLDWDKNGDYLAIGLTGGATTLQVYEVTTSPLSIILNASIGIGQLRGVNWNPRYPNLLATAGNTSPQFRIYEHDAAGGSFTLLASIAIGFSCFDVAWNKVNGECLALGIASNGGTDLRTYFWNNNDESLTEISGFDLGTNNTRQVVWARDGNFLLVGSNDNSVKIYRVDAAFEEFVISNIRLFLNGNVTLSDCAITFTGNNLLYGNTNTLSLDSTCTLKIAADASLLLEDIRITGIKDQSIQLLDSTSTITYKNCTYVLDESITFDQGRFDVIRDFIIQGESYSFDYNSDQISTIGETGRLLVDTNVTFSYVPSIADNALLQLTADSSIFRLQSGTLATNSTGLHLTKGIVQVDGRSYLHNLGVNTSQGIIFGDSMDSNNNICLEIEPAANLEVLEGFFVNNNLLS